MVVRAPDAPATIAANRPIGPAPMTATWSPGRSFERSTARTAQPSGSVSAAYRSDTLSGTRKVFCAGTTTVGAQDPLRSVRRRGQTGPRPDRQSEQVPHGVFGITVTRSPTNKFVTALPISTIRPEN